MRLLADESCDFAIVRALRQAGHDVVAIAEDAAQAPDEEVLSRAEPDGRVVLTEDKDFGRLIFAQGRSSCGVVLVRFPADARAAVGEAVVHLCQQNGPALPESFTVIEPGQVRISRLPGS